jgi:hypothetical protein
VILFDRLPDALQHCSAGAASRWSLLISVELWVDHGDLPGFEVASKVVRKQKRLFAETQANIHCAAPVARDIGHRGVLGEPLVKGKKRQVEVWDWQHARGAVRCPLPRPIMTSARRLLMLQNDPSGRNNLMCPSHRKSSPKNAVARGDQNVHSRHRMEKVQRGVNDGSLKEASTGKEGTR